MQDRLKKNSKIDTAWSAVVDSVLGEKHGSLDVLTGVRLKSTKDGSMRDLKIAGLFLAIGHVPNTKLFKGQLVMTPEGYLLTRTALAWKGIEAPSALLDSLPNYGTATNVDGVFACGDVVDTHYRQAITAAGSGCAAAMDCEKWLEATGEGH
jgi:thioredoxin reductase (NADPH)